MGYIVEEVAPAAEPLLLPAVKNFLKVSVSNDDDFIGDLIQSAREEVEGFTGRSIVNKTYRQSLDSFPYFVDTIMSQMAYPPSYYSLPRYSTTLWNYSQMIKLLRAPLAGAPWITYTDSVTQEIQTLYAALPNWQRLTEYSIAASIEDPNGSMQVVTAVGENDEDGTSMSGATEPTWATGTNQTTEDGGLTWTCQGAVPTASFIYDSDSCPPRIFPLAGQTWPPVLYVPNAVQIHFPAGYGNDGKAAPAALRQAMRLMISDGYYNREPIVAGAIQESPTLKRLLYRWRIPIKAATRG